MLVSAPEVVSEAGEHSFDVLQYFVHDGRCFLFEDTGIEIDRTQSLAEDTQFPCDVGRSFAPEKFWINTSASGFFTLQPSSHALQRPYCTDVELPQFVGNAAKNRCQIISSCLVALNNIGESLIDD